MFLRSIFSFVLVILSVSFAHGQQTNIHVSMPPLIYPDIRHDYWQVSASLIRMSGERIDSNGIDINYTFRGEVSPNVATDATIGFALLGAGLGGEMEIDTFKRHMSAIVMHASFNFQYLVMKKPSSSLTLFVGMPFSYGDFIIENQKEDVQMYNLMAGLQGGARLGLKIGDFKSFPWVMVNLMGGYIERYDGGVYSENLNSGSIPIFAVLSYGLEILYLPLNLTLGGIYQRTFESGDNKAIETAIIQLSFNVF